MKKTLKLMPEYQCYPLWLYDSDGTLIDNIIPESLQANKELMDALYSSSSMRYTRMHRRHTPT